MTSDSTSSEYPENNGPDLELLAKIRPWLGGLPDQPIPDGLVALPYFAWGDLAEGNRKILNVQPRYKEGELEWGFWDLFEMLHVWMLYRDELESAASDRIRETFHQSLVPEGRIRKKEFDFTNINHPLTCTALGIVGGEQFDMSEAVDSSYAKLNNFIDNWSKFGSFSEYNSPTYQCVDFVALATIRMFSINDETARKAQILEERLWLETAFRYHAPTGTLAGPHSRAKSWDKYGGASDAHYALHRVIGSDTPLWLDVTHRLESIKRNQGLDHRITWAGRCAHLTFACPEYIRYRLRRPRVPHQLTATTRWQGPDALLKKGETDITTFLSEKFSLGSASSQGSAREANNFTAFWRKRQPVKAFHDIKSLYLTHTDHYCLQDGERGMVVADKHEEETLTIYVRLHDELDEVRVGEKQMNGESVEAAPGETVVIRDGVTWLGLRPLPGNTAHIVRTTDELGDRLDIVIKQHADEMAPEQTYEGFCLQLAEASDQESFDAFQQRVAVWQLSAEMNTQGVYTATWESDGEALSMRVDFPNSKLLERHIGGRHVNAAMLASPLVRQGIEAELTVRDATLIKGEGVSAYVYGDTEKNVWVAVNPTAHATPVELRTPSGRVKLDSLGFGKAELHADGPPHLIIKEAVPSATEVTVSPELKELTITSTEEQGVTLNVQNLD